MKTPTLSSRNTVLRVARGAVYVCFALALSYAEVLFPIADIFPVPGFKLGLANIAVMIAFYKETPVLAAEVSVCRTVISFFLFSNAASLLFSAAGAAFAYASLFISKYLFGDKISFIGVSVLSAFFHNMGQLTAAFIITESTLPFSYFPFLTVSAVLCGSISGISLMLISGQVFKNKGAFK